MSSAGATETTPILGGDEQNGGKKKAIPKRFIFALLGFTGFINVYAMRVNLSVAMVAMVNQSAYESRDGITHVAACPELMSTIGNGTVEMADQAARVFDWNPRIQSIILGSFFYGYVVTQLPGGMMAEREHAKWLFGLGVLGSSVLTIFTPLFAWWGTIPLICLRVMEGLAEGVTFPAMNALIGRWSPKLERSRMSTFIFTGSSLGTVIAMALTGLIADSPYLGGWPTVFYFFGTLGCFWFFAWLYEGFERPSQHNRITEAELRYIEDNQDTKSVGPVPWHSILTSVPVWALALTHFGNNWGFITLLTELPTYLSTVLHFDLKENGLLSSTPYILQALCAWIASCIADKLRQNSKLRITTIRKILNSVAFFGPGICVLVVSLIGCRPTEIVLLLCLAMGLNGFIFSGFNVTHVDMSPDYAGTLMGITNCVANFSGFFAPYVVGLITSRGQTVHNWGLIFTITSAVYFITGALYNVFASAELQPWGLSTPVPTSIVVDTKKKEKAAS